MTYDVKTVKEYIEAIPEERQIIINKFREIFNSYLPNGFKEIIQYNMITYVVPLELYPKGYLKNNVPLPFISLASQKNHISVYHMGLYMDDNILKWFKDTYNRLSDKKLDMGKSCIRFKPTQVIPYEVFVELAQKITPSEFIEFYEKSR